MSTFASALARRSNQSIWWLEIAGIPYAFGTRAKDSSWFSGRDAHKRFEGIKPWLGVDDQLQFDPQLSPQNVDFIEGRVNVQTSRIVIVDVDGTLSGYTGIWRTDQQATLNADLTASTPSTIAYTGSFAGGSGVAHLGAEVVKFTSNSAGALGGLTRGYYRTLAQAHATGESIAPYPMGFENRRAWLYYGLDAENSEDATQVFTGYIRAVAWQRGARELVLQMDDSVGGLKKKVFVDLATTFSDATTATPTFQAHLRQTSQPDFLTLIGGHYTQDDLTTHHVLGPDDTVLRVQRDASIPAVFGGPSFRFLGQGIVVADDPKIDGKMFPARAIVGISHIDLEGAMRFIAGNHPLEVALQIMMSTGTGVNGTYDTLPAAWGCALTEDDVDVPSVEALRDRTPRWELATIIFEAQDAREFILRECLRPFGYFFRPSLDGRVSFGIIENGSPDDFSGAPHITADDLAVDEKGQLVQLDGPVSLVDQVVKGVSWLDSPALQDGKLVPVEPFIWMFPTAILRPNEYPNAQIVEVVSLALHGQRAQRQTAGSSATSARFPSSFPVQGAEGLAAQAELVARYRTYFQKPPAVLTVAVKITRLLDDNGAALNVGAYVLLTLPNIPNFFTGTRGLSLAVHQVVGRRWDVSKSCVILDLARTGIESIRTRFIAPTADITAWAAPVLTVAANSYSPTGAHDIDAFTVGDKVRVYTADRGTRSGVVTIAAKSAPGVLPTTITLSGTPSGHTPANTDVLEFADYDECTPTQQETTAFMADNAETLGSLNAQADVHS
jgi:hypothetical protein